MPKSHYNESINLSYMSKNTLAECVYFSTAHKGSRQVKNMVPKANHFPSYLFKVSDPNFNAEVLRDILNKISSGLASHLQLMTPANKLCELGISVIRTR